MEFCDIFFILCVEYIYTLYSWMLTILSIKNILGTKTKNSTLKIKIVSLCFNGIPNTLNGFLFQYEKSDYKTL